jgi:dihydrofolate reductase
MRRLIFQEFFSLDGFAADKNRSTAFFEDPVYAKESDEDLLEEMFRFDTILLGANTYKMFVDFWPTATNNEQIVADRLNSIPKIVFSNTLQSAPWGKWPAATIVSGDAVKAIADLKRKNAGDMVLWGSISLAQQLMQSNLIDEYQFRIVPVLLGEGIPLFNQAISGKLELTKSKVYSSGLLLAHYRKQ